MPEHNAKTWRIQIDRHVRVGGRRADRRVGCIQRTNGQTAGYLGVFDQDHPVAVKDDTVVIGVSIIVLVPQWCVVKIRMCGDRQGDDSLHIIYARWLI